MIETVLNCDCLDYLKESHDIFDLTIIDPPYFRILKGEKWDRFKNYEEYISWFKEFIQLLSLRIRYSGTLLLYGCTRNFNILCDLNNLLIQFGFYFVEEIVIDKGMKSIAGRVSSKIKMCPPVSENIMVYRKDAKPFIKGLLKQKQIEKGLTNKEISLKLGFAKNGGGNWVKYCGNTEYPLLPAKEHWLKLQELLEIDITYDKIEEVYNGKLGLTNVWNDISFGRKVKRTTHPSEKPIELSERCIDIFSRVNDNVFIPFLGSGSELIACRNLNRICIGCEKNINYYNEYIKSIL